MKKPELSATQTMRLLLIEALSDRRIDDTDKAKIKALGEALGLSREEIEQEYKKSLATGSSQPSREFDPLALFQAACECALADGVLTQEERKHLYALKHVLQIQDVWYQQQMQQLEERSQGDVDECESEEIEDIDLENFEPVSLIESIITNIEKVIVGKTEVIKLILTGALANAHVLLEDVPGTGKTMLARSLAASIDCTYKRIQFTPDLLPMDVTGSMIYNPQSSTFSFKRGPVFTNVFLADEINRATPRTQSSLLEVMEERQVSIDGAAFSVPRVFFVLATQNPVEQHGTYPLPEAQLDRFLLKLGMGYPDSINELKMLKARINKKPITELTAVVSKIQFQMIQKYIKEKVSIVPELLDYILAIIKGLREHESLVLGPSPRAAIGFMHAARAWACVNGRDYVIPDDIKELAQFVLAHRLVLQPGALVKRLSGKELVHEVLNNIPVPIISNNKKAN